MNSALIVDSDPDHGAIALRSIEELCQTLTAEFTRDERGPRAADLVSQYTRDNDDWQRFAFFSDEHYTRNLVDTSELFELMVVCWSPEQESPIHNHAGSNCWMGVLEGHVEEVHFDPPHEGKPPVQRHARTYQRGQVAFIRDEIALHQVRTSPGKRAATLHLYAGPITECNCYCSETGKITRRELAYTTVRGEAPA